MKKQITIKELKSLIKEEAQKLNRRTILENEKKALQEEFEEMDEGLGGIFKSKATKEKEAQAAQNAKNAEIEKKKAEEEAIIARLKANDKNPIGNEKPNSLGFYPEY